MGSCFCPRFLELNYINVKLLTAIKSRNFDVYGDSSLTGVAQSHLTSSAALLVDLDVIVIIYCYSSLQETQ